MSDQPSKEATPLNGAAASSGNTVLDYPSSVPGATTHAGAGAGRQQCLVFLVPGNPGCVDYYQPFLETLRRRFDETEAQNPHVALHLRAENLVGFTDREHQPADVRSHKPFDVAAQIRHLVSRIETLQRRSGEPDDSSSNGGSNNGGANSGANTRNRYDQVILLGHSVGAYIALEVFHHFEQLPSDANTNYLRAGILLFPTISDMAQSPSGQRLQHLSRWGFLDRHAHHVAKGFVDLWPTALLKLFVRGVLGFPEHAAAATVRFLATRYGIWQALHLGKDEVRVIADDVWPDELWEIADPVLAGRGDATKFFMYFGRDDHWVANACRDDFIRRRNQHAAAEGGEEDAPGPGLKRGRTKIVIDDAGLPHAFCLKHSEPVAEKVGTWINEIAQTIPGGASSGPEQPPVDRLES